MAGRNHFIGNDLWRITLYNDDNQVPYAAETRQYIQGEMCR